MISKVAFLKDFKSQELKETETLLPSLQQQLIDRKKDDKREQSLCVRALLLRILREMGHIDYFECLSQTQSGKPYLKGHPDIFISFSHSKSAVAVAVSNRPCGTDIEKIRKTSPAFRSRIGSEGMSDCELFRIWTVKEAYFKATDISVEEMLKIEIQSIEQKAEIKTEIIDGYVFSGLTLKA